MDYFIAVLQQQFTDIQTHIIYTKSQNTDTDVGKNSIYKSISTNYYITT